MGEQRNFILFIVLALAIYGVYYTFVVGPTQERLAAERAAQEAAVVETVDDGLPTAEPAENLDAAEFVTRASALAATERVDIRTPSVAGSLSLVGAKIDDLALLDYHETVDPESPVVTLFNPAGGPEAYYALHGWLSIGGGDLELPGKDTPWRLAADSPSVLTPGTPVKLRYVTQQGLEFERTISVDDRYMFTIRDVVTNRSSAAVTLKPYGVVRRVGLPDSLRNFYILHEGMVGVLDNKLLLRKYKKLEKDGDVERESQGGWLGITDKYWLAALVPHPERNTGRFSTSMVGGNRIYQADYVMDAIAVDPGKLVEVKTLLFAGAKRTELLQDYERELDIAKFDMAIDWGNFWFLTRPFFSMLHAFATFTGSFAAAILMLTIVVKAVFFPIANMSYKAMARMKGLQPKITELRERFKADPQRQQKEMVALYQREKVNPLAGCLPLIPQMIVFFALYKTLVVTIEMRHAAFPGWIQDMSARDPTNMWNVFGLLPYDPASVPLIGGLLAGSLGIGALALIYGLTMGAMQTLNPPPPDPTQAKIFAFMPIIFTFILAPFAAGLLIYWIWNNVLSFAQQYLIMRRQGVDTPIGSFLANNYKRVRRLIKPTSSGGDS